MGARKYGISLLMINSISHSLLRSLLRYRVEYEKRNSISPSNMYYFVYYINIYFMYQSSGSFNVSFQPHPGHLTPFPARGGGGEFDHLCLPGGGAFDHHL